MEKKCDFCEIIRGEKEAFVVFEDRNTIVFLDKRPLFPGHCLVVPREHVSTLIDADKEILEPLFMIVKILAGAVEKAMNAGGTFVAVNNKISQSVPHLHIHVVPRNKKDGLKGFFWPRNPYKDEKHMKEVQEKIVNAVSNVKSDY